MKIVLLKNVVYKGEYLTAGNSVEVVKEVAEKWIKAKLAQATKTTEKAGK